MSLRKDTLSHAYELMKVEDPKKRKRLADQVARGELTLVKLREKIEGRPARTAADAERGRGREPEVARPSDRPRTPSGWDGRERRRRSAIADDSLVAAKQQLADAVEELLDVIRNPDVLDGDRSDRPGQPRQVPDDREAPARERDRRRPDGRHGPLGRPVPSADTKKPAPGAPASSILAGIGRGQWPLAACSRGLRGLARRGTLGLGGVPLGLRGVLRGLLLGSCPCPASRRRTPRA